MIHFHGLPGLPTPSRRALLQAGGSSLLGLSLGHLLAQPALSAGYEPASRPKAKNVILLYLYGAVSQIDTFDPKPDGPAEIRGPFGTIPSSLPGVAVSELLPGVAQRLDRVTLVRSMTHPVPIHNVANAVTGIAQTTVDMELSPRDPRHWPFFGSVLNYLEDRDRKGPPATVLPPNILLPWRQGSRAPYPRAGFWGASLGSRYDPTAVEFEGEGTEDSATASKDPYRAIPAASRFLFPSTERPEGVSLERFTSRKDLLAELDQKRRLLATAGDGEAVGFFQEAALRMADSTSFAAALDLTREPAALREQYGRHVFGQAALAARRLIEAGTRVVTVMWDEYSTTNSAWDVHLKLKQRMKDDLCPRFDMAFSSLLDDLEAKGLLDETLVLCLTEHGRTPKPEGDDGRNHWSGVYSILMAGAGIARGKVVGQSDAIGGNVKERPVDPKDILCTIYHLLGIDPHRVIFDRAGRPMPVVSGGKVVREALA